MKWLSDSLWGFRCWLSQRMSAGLPRAPVPQVYNFDDLLPVMDLLSKKYKMDPGWGAVDFSYDPAVIQAAINSGKLDSLVGLDCDDLNSLIRGMLMNWAQATATVFIWDSIGMKHHAVTWIMVGGRQYVADYTGTHDLAGTNICAVFNQLVPGAFYKEVSWHWEFPFPDPRRA